MHRMVQPAELLALHCHMFIASVTETATSLALYMESACCKRFQKLGTASAQAAQDFALVHCACFLHAKQRLANLIEDLHIQV